MSLMLHLSYLGHGIDMHMQRNQDYPKPICMINICIHVTASNFWDSQTRGDLKLEWLFVNIASVLKGKTNKQMGKNTKYLDEKSSVKK